MDTAADATAEVLDSVQDSGCTYWTDTACCQDGVVYHTICFGMDNGKLTWPAGAFACNMIGGPNSCAETCGLDGVGDGLDAADESALTDVADVPDVGDAPDAGPCDGFVYIDFPCQSETVCVGNHHVRRDHTMSCEENGYDPKCCSGASCAEGAVEACPVGRLCIGAGWDQGCKTTDCGGPGGAPCPNGKVLWQKTYASNEDSHFEGAEATADGGFLLSGVTAQKGWLVRTDALGNVLWQCQGGIFGEALGGASLGPVRVRPDGIAIVDRYSRLLRGDPWGHATCSQAGLCAALPWTACDDANDCTVDGCVPQTGCTHTAAADGSACGAGNVCTAGACL